MIDPKTAERIKELPEWKALEQHLRECRELLDSVTGITDNFGEEARGRKRAVETIDNILEPFQFSFREDVDRKKKLQEKYGIM